MKKALPVWQIVAAVAAALVVVGLIFTFGGSGEASKQELVNIRQNQQKMTIGAPPDTGGNVRQNQPGYDRGAPPGGLANLPR
jgi:hypothetical protein